MPANATEEPPCTTTITEFPKFSNLHTTTIYETTITQISELDCSGCVLTVTKRHFGHGPVSTFLPKYRFRREREEIGTARDIEGLDMTSLLIVAGKR